MNTTKPSDGAVRAATACESLRQRRSADREALSLLELAAVIDAELSTPDLEQRAQAAAEEISPECSLQWYLDLPEPTSHHWQEHLEAEMVRSQLKQTILSHFAGMQGGNEKLREALTTIAN